VKEAEKIVKAIQDKEDPSSAVSADADREATVEMHYMKQTEVVLRDRIRRLAELLTSDTFTQSMVGCFNKQLFDFYAAEGAFLHQGKDPKGSPWYRFVSEDGRVLTENFSSVNELKNAYG